MVLSEGNVTGGILVLACSEPLVSAKCLLEAGVLLSFLAIGFEVYFGIEHSGTSTKPTLHAMASWN